MNTETVSMHGSGGNRDVSLGQELGEHPQQRQPLSGASQSRPSRPKRSPRPCSAGNPRKYSIKSRETQLTADNLLTGNIGVCGQKNNKSKSSGISSSPVVVTLEPTPVLEYVAAEEKCRPNLLLACLKIRQQQEEEEDTGSPRESRGCSLSNRGVVGEAGGPSPGLGGILRVQMGSRHSKAKKDGPQSRATKQGKSQQHHQRQGNNKAGSPPQQVNQDHLCSHNKHGIFKRTKVEIRQSVQLSSPLHDSAGRLHGCRSLEQLNVPLVIQGSATLDLRVLKLKASIDKKLTTIDERSSAVLKYRTPHFRAAATIELPVLSEAEGYQIGWIQTCMDMKFINTYGEAGITSWEFPEIVLGKYSMVSDADGKQYPWYGSRHEVQTIQGPCLKQSVTIHMNDNFFPQVTWYVPHNMYDKKPRLTHIYRNQKFYTFLVAKNLATEEYHVLKTVFWSMQLKIEVNPENPLGKRATLVGPMEQETPKILDDNLVRLEPYALKPPNANNSQTLVWRPRRGGPRVVVPPVETTVNMDSYLDGTKSLGEKLLAMSPES